MPEAISDSSTLIHLAGIERLQLLKEFYGKILITPAVWDEVVVAGAASLEKFRTEQEMREFWDTHDSAEYFEDMKDDEVWVEFNRDKGVLVIPMSVDRVRSLRGIALEEGVSSNVSEKLDR